MSWQFKCKECGDDARAAPDSERRKLQLCGVCYLKFKFPNKPISHMNKTQRERTSILLDILISEIGKYPALMAKWEFETGLKRETILRYLSELKVDLLPQKEMTTR